MTSDELWHLAFAATKKRFEMLSCDLEANRVKLDRQLRDEKRRKPSKYGGAGGRATKGARGSRNGGGGGAAAAAAATAAAAAAAAARAAQSERVKALNMEGQVLEDLRQSVRDFCPYVGWVGWGGGGGVLVCCLLSSLDHRPSGPFGMRFGGVWRAPEKKEWAFKICPGRT